MSYKVSAADGCSLSLQQDSELLSMLQNIALLLNTKRGTVPMHSEFGLPMEFVDKPIDAAEAIALEEFEPRARLDDVYFEKSADGKINLTVEVSIADEQSD